MPKTLKELYDDLRVTQAPRAGAAATTDDPFIIKLAQLILAYGIQIKASDIHIEPAPIGARIRYRIDGMLHEMLDLPQETRDHLLRSIKVKAGMATDAVGRSKPQDGRIDFDVNGRKIDLRLSSFPTLFGDVLVFRILDRSAPLLALDQLGLPPDFLKDFERLVRRPNGMIVVTGPAGSGKTTLLYAALNKVRSPSIKIITLEDPVEYQVDGIDQGQINPAVGLTFASGLRAILRQDANIIMVGEIRDKETAEIAVRAALTGHLVLSTMHTRNAYGAATRLIEMGIEPHLIVSSITGVVAQRLVRLLCPQCKTPDPVTTQAFAALWAKEAGSLPPPASLNAIRKGVGCPACNRTGFQGRMGIFELLLLTDDLRQQIIERASGQSSSRPGGFGFRTMRLNGLEKVAQGLTTIEEVLRVTGEAEDA
ncbi:MAG: type II/IV secretion system protein [Candidatus Omnitrophica bacterium]|nr:type II/IV secretion system protein [Candidatus Omnitrophota bacterium]